MNRNNIYILEDRGLLYINGDDAKEFLQNIITNNIENVSEDRSCFSALLTPQGKYLYDFIIIKHKSGYFLDCEKKIIENLYKQLNLYKLRSKVDILNLSNEFVVANFTKEKFLELENSKDELGFTIKFREDPIILDPRSDKLGARLVINLEKLYLSIKKLGLKVSDVNEYYNYSYELGIAQIDTNNLQDKIFGIECNFEELNGIDFKKGCYVGQENTARIKLKNKLSKRLLPIEIIDGKLSEDEAVYYNNIEIGRVLINEEYPFALIKYSNENFSKNFTFKSKNGSFKIFIPEWLKI